MTDEIAPIDADRDTTDATVSEKERTHAEKALGLEGEPPTPDQTGDSIDQMGTNSGVRTPEATTLGPKREADDTGPSAETTADDEPMSDRDTTDATVSEKERTHAEKALGLEGEPPTPDQTGDSIDQMGTNSRVRTPEATTLGPKREADDTGPSAETTGDDEPMSEATDVSLADVDFHSTFDSYHVPEPLIFQERAWTAHSRTRGTFFAWIGVGLILIVLAGALALLLQ